MIQNEEVGKQCSFLAFLAHSSSEEERFYCIGKVDEAVMTVQITHRVKLAKLREIEPNQKSINSGT